jgi:hypothetical protein
MSKEIVLDDDDDRVLVYEEMTLDDLLIDDVAQISGAHPFVVVAAINSADPYMLAGIVDAYQKGLALIREARSGKT